MRKSSSWYYVSTAHIKASLFTRIPSHKDNWPRRIKYSLQQLIRPPVFKEMTHRVFGYLSLVSKTKLGYKYTPNQLKQMAIMKGDKVYAKSSFTFHFNKANHSSTLKTQI